MMAGKLSRPDAPLAQQITHHSIALSWDAAFDKVKSEIGEKSGDARVRVCVQLLTCDTGPTGFTNLHRTVYLGYAKNCVISTLTPSTRYKFRLQLSTDTLTSDWSPEVVYSTQKEPMYGDSIHKAILKEDKFALQSVLDAKEAPIDAPDKYGFTPLMQTAQHGHIEMMNLLIDYGADINLQNDIGKTALMLAAYSGRLDSVKLLRQQGAKYDLQDTGGSTALHWACDSNNPELVDWMLSDGADVSTVDINGRSPLLRLASLGGNRDITNVLVRHGADINALDKNRHTALMLGTINGHVGMVEFLLERNADATVVNEFGKTAFDMALSMDKKVIANLLETYMDKHHINHRYY